MLKDENNNRLYFQSDVFCSLMKSDDRSIKELKEIIAKKACVSTHAVKRWQLGKNSPSGLDIVNVIAEVLNVEPEILVGRNKPEYKNDSIQKDNVHIENNEHEEQEINCDLSWNTIRSIFKKKPYLRYKIRAFLLLIYGSNVYLSWWDKISILYNGKKDGDEQLRMCLSEICSFAKRNSCNQIDAFIDGNVQVAINQRRILKTKMDFLEICLLERFEGI